uniref:serine/arginine repetitive matrix protein 1-like n=1 Tax=Nyctereutes procyonoides TaxID=34880 RepID=UPI0024444A96|nr:serine/arginine repetitive matrix protein 1-like [Nyctereutes procyonoides]
MAPEGRSRARRTDKVRKMPLRSPERGKLEGMRVPGWEESNGCQPPVSRDAASRQPKLGPTRPAPPPASRRPSNSQAAGARGARGPSPSGLTRVAPQLPVARRQSPGLCCEGPRDGAAKNARGEARSASPPHLPRPQSVPGPSPRGFSPALSAASFKSPHLPPPVDSDCPKRNRPPPSLSAGPEPSSGSAGPRPRAPVTGNMAAAAASPD